MANRNNLRYGKVSKSKPKGRHSNFCGQGNTNNPVRTNTYFVCAEARSSCVSHPHNDLPMEPFSWHSPKHILFSFAFCNTSLTNPHIRKKITADLPIGINQLSHVSPFAAYSHIDLSLFSSIICTPRVCALVSLLPASSPASR